MSCDLISRIFICISSTSLSFSLRSNFWFMISLSFPSTCLVSKTIYSCIAAFFSSNNCTSNLRLYASIKRSFSLTWNVCCKVSNCDIVLAAYSRKNSFSFISSRSKIYVPSISLICSSSIYFGSLVSLSFLTWRSPADCSSKCMLLSYSSRLRSLSSSI